jgi:hypothetical protein
MNHILCLAGILLVSIPSYASLRADTLNVPIPGAYPQPKVSYSVVNNNKVMLIIRLDGEQNDEYSDLLAAYYRENSYQVLSDTTSNTPVTNLIAGALSLYDPVEDESKQFTTYTLKLILSIYKKANSAPCSERVYKTKLRLAPGDSKDRLIKQGFFELLDKIKSTPSIPICAL